MIQNRKYSKGSGDSRKFFQLENFQFENGQTLNHLQICYESWGTLNEKRDNAILIGHALTGTSHAASCVSDDKSGWWDFLIGPGKPFDTDKYFVLCSNALGGCSGSTGPSSTNPMTGRPYGISFPVVTIRDMVHAQKKLIDYLNLQNIVTVAGGSMGGMQALEWAALYPDLVQSIIPIATPGRANPQSIAFRKAQRKAIMMDPDWSAGDYYGQTIPQQGIEIARMMGFITYRSEREFAERFGREHADGDYLSLTGRFAVEQYLEYHGCKLAEWFDANTYLYFSKAMDLHDLGYGFASFKQGILRIQAPMLIIGFDSDLLFPSYQQREVAEILGKTNPKVEFREIESPFGHDAFLLEKEQLCAIIENFLHSLTYQTKEAIHAISN